MLLIKRTRGRPIGTGKDDTSALMEMAVMILSNTSLRPTTAIRRIFDTPNASTVRRLQGKWKLGKDQFLSEAKRRQIARPTRVTHRTSTDYLRMVSNGDINKKLSEQIDSLMNTFGSARIADTLKEASSYWNDPVTDLIRRLNNNPIMDAMHQFQSDPISRAMRELHDTALMRVSRQIENANRMITGGHRL